MSRPSKKCFYKQTICVSERDRQIYHEAMVVGRSQRELAVQFKLSQQRISKIVNRTSVWMSETAPHGFAEIPRPQRLYGVARLYKQKLEYFENEAKAAWRNSKVEYAVTSTHDVIELPGDKLGLSHGKVSKKTPKPDIKYLDAAERYAAKLVRFEGFDENGAVARNNNDRLHEVPQTLPDAELDDMIAVGQRAARMKQEREEEKARGRRGEGETGRRGELKSAEQTLVLSPPLRVSPSPAPAPPPPQGALSDAVPETHSVREITGPNDFDNRLSQPAMNVGWVERYPARPTEPNVVAPSTVGLRSTFDPPYESAAPPKEYPPTPEGYYRHGNRCRPQMKSRDPIDCRKIKLFITKKPAKWYELSPDGKEWWARY